MSASPSARAFDALRPAIVVRLIELRASLDPALARSDEATARSQIEAVLGDFGEYLATGDLAAHRAFLTSFVAKRAAEELGPSAALSTLVAIGDTAVQVVQEKLAGPSGDELGLLVARLTTSSVRIVNDLIAEELIARRGLAHDLRTGQRGGGRIDTDADLRGGPAPSKLGGGRQVVGELISSGFLSHRSSPGSHPGTFDGGHASMATHPGATHPGTHPGATHPGTDPSTDPGTDPGERPPRPAGSSSRGSGKSSRGTRR
jgi:hypothetical protein